MNLDKKFAVAIFNELYEKIFRNIRNLYVSQLIPALTHMPKQETHWLRSVVMKRLMYLSSSKWSWQTVLR